MTFEIRRWLAVGRWMSTINIDICSETTVNFAYCHEAKEWLISWMGICAGTLSFIYIDLQVIRKEVQCPICLGIIKKTRTVMECLHRFCRECIDKSMRMGNNECPACRTHCASRRSLRDDSRYDALISALFPDIEKYEAEELAFCEEEKSRNKQIQASIAQIIKRQTEALGKKRSSRKVTGSQRNIRETPSRRSKRKRSGKTEFESDDDEDLENTEGQTSSYSGEQYKEDQHRQISRRRIGSSHSFSPATSSGGLCIESKLEHRRSYPGIMWNIEMRTWGRNGVRSGHVRKNPQSTHLDKFKEFLQNFEKKDCQNASFLTPSRVDKPLLAANEPPQTQGSHNKQDTIHLSSSIDDNKGRLSEVVDQFRDRLQLSEEKLLPGFETNSISHGGQLVQTVKAMKAQTT
ncbi:hypothetical protein V2J09_002725 [Rumex salicifolius]